MRAFGHAGAAAAGTAVPLVAAVLLARLASQVRAGTDALAGTTAPSAAAWLCPRLRAAALQPGRDPEERAEGVAFESPSRAPGAPTIEANFPLPISAHPPRLMTDLRTQLQEKLSAGYTLERELGRGGMATVFLARDLKHDPSGRAQGAPSRAGDVARARALPRRRSWCTTRRDGSGRDTILYRGKG